MNTEQFQNQIQAILIDCYSENIVDAGMIDDFIQPSVLTSDFDLPNNYKVRIHLEKGIVYYAVFRAK